MEDKAFVLKRRKTPEDIANEQLGRENELLQKKLKSLEAYLAYREARIKELEARIATFTHLT